MVVWPGMLTGTLFLTVVLLSVKIVLMRKSVREIKKALDEKLTSDTNTLIDLAGRDRCMCDLAESLNGQLRILREKRHRYEQGDLRLKEAVTNISHDLRTPLTAICGYLSLLEQEEKSEAACRYLKVIRERTEALSQLTEELLAYSVAVSDADRTDYERFSLNEALEESISAYYAALKGRGISPDISMPDEKVLRCLSRSSLSRIYGNVIHNAIKYSDGDLKIILHTDGTAEFSNHASGFNEIEAARLFDRFYTVETARKSTGLGLSIAKVLTEQMGGSITASYADGVICVRTYFPEASFSGDGPGNAAHVRCDIRKGTAIAADDFSGGGKTI